MSKRQFTADPAAAQAKRRELIDKLENGFQRMQSSNEYRAYLDTVSRFHNYSINNTMLIWMQRPDAERVAGFRTWLSVGRHVRKGERGISIFAPMPYWKTVTNADGEDEEYTRIAFRSVAVFDISQTDGEPLAAPPVTRLGGSDEHGLWASLALIATGERLTIDRTPERATSSINGFYARVSGEIWVSPDLAPTMSAKTLCHELAHHFAEHIDNRQEHETIAESVAYVVLGHFGIDASAYSFGYLACWTDAKTFKAALGDIHRIANTIIRRIEGEERAAQAA